MELAIPGVALGLLYVVSNQKKDDEANESFTNYLPNTNIPDKNYYDDENTNVYEHEIALIDSLKENEIAVLCCHGNEKIAPWGELLSTRATYLKSAGCLTDGCVRDTKMINEIGFPVFAKGTNPVDTKFRGKMMMADVPGEIANVYVESGDLVFGDNDGVVIVPSKVIDEVIRKALEKVSSENTVRDELKKGDSLTAVFEKHKIL